MFATTFAALTGFSASANGADRFAVASTAWNLTSTWSASSGGAAGASVPGAGDDVFIGEAATNRTVTVPSGVAIACSSISIGNSAQANNNALTFNAGSLSSSVSGNITINRPGGANTNSLNVNAVTLAVGGTVTLAGTAINNNREAQIAITTGTLTISGDLVFITGEATTNILNIGAGGTLNLAGAWTGTVGDFNPNVTSTFNYNGAGAQTVNSSFVAYENLTLSGGGLKTTTGVTVNTKLSIQGTATVGNTITYSTAILEYKGSAAQTTSNNEFPNAMTGLTDVVIDNASGVVLNAAKSGAADLAITTGTLDLNDLSHSFGSLSGGGTITNSGAGGVTFTSGSSNASTAFTGVVQNGSGTVALTKNGTGALTLSGNNTYSGTTTLSAGTLNINSATAIGTGTFTISATSTINNTSAGAITLSNNNVQNWNADFTFTGTQGLNLGTGAVTMNASRQVTVAGGTLTVGGSISGATFGLTKEGAGTLVLNGAVGTTTGTVSANTGTLTLAGANTYSGATNVTGATLNINSPTAIGTGTLVINGSSVIDNTSAGSITLSNNNAQTWNAGFTFTGTQNLNLGTGAASMVSANRTITVSANTLTVGGVISQATGNRLLTKAGSGALTLSGTNTFSGGTTLSAGTLNIDNAQALGTVAGTFTISAGTINNTSGGAITTVNYPLAWNGDFTFTGSNALNLGTGAVTVNANRQVTVSASTLTVGGGIGTAARNLTKAGAGTLVLNGVVATTTGTMNVNAGTLTLAGANTYSGTTTLSVGTLNINNATALGTGTFTISGASTIDNTSGGAITLTNNNVQNWNADFTFTGTQSLNLGTGAVTLSANRQVTVGANTLTVGGTISAGALDLTKAGAGTLSFGSNTVTLNNLTISAGTLTSTSGTMNLNGSLSNSGSFTHNSGTVAFNGSAAQITGSQATTFNNLTVGNANGLTLNTSAGIDTTVNGTLALTTGDIFTGAHTLIMGVNAPTSTGNKDVVGNVSRTDLGSAATRTFGNPNVQITVNTGTITSMTVSLTKSSPTGFSSSVTRTYFLEPGTGTLTSATVRLHYLTSELQSNPDDGSLILWRLSGGTWNAVGRTTGVAGSYVEKTGVTAFSPWTIARDISAPTDVAMLDLKATRYDNRVLLEWQTGYEVSNVGFNVYRGKKGNFTKITPEPIAGSALIFGPKISLRAGFAYTWWDNDAQAGDDNTYWVEDLDISGRTSMKGPFYVTQSATGDQPATSKEKAATLGAIGSEAAKLGASAPVERVAKLLKPTAAGLTAQASIASQQAVKLSVKHEGWYRVEQADLLAAGFSANANALKLQLFVDGQEVPILVTTTGSSPGKGSKPISAPWDGIEFYGIGIDSAYTDSHVYWLVAGTQNGLRINTAPSKGGSPASATFSFAVERRDKLVYFSALKNGGAEKFFGPLIYNALPVDQSVVLKNVAPTGNATVDVSLQGFTDVPHSIRVLFNGTELGTVQFNGLAKGTAQYSIPQSSLLEGSNQVQFISPAGFSDISMSEYVRVTYQHTNTADGNSLRFPATGGQQATIAGFTSAAVRVLDVTNPGSPQEVETTVEQDGAEYTATATVPGAGTRTLLAFASDQKKTPAALVANQPSSWATPKNAADYIAVTRKDLIASIQPLVNQRKSQGLKTALVDIEDVYDEFSFGHKTPQALKDFFAYAKTSWKLGPRFALLGGDATYDPKNYTGVGDYDVIPTRLFESTFNETGTDDWFVDVDGDFVPDIAIGRLPVRTPQETTTLAAKIIRYDRSAAVRRVLLVADHNDGYDFEAADTQLQTLIPAALMVVDIRRGQVGDGAARTQLLNELNVGAKFVNYYGHGSTRIWTDAQILTAADAANLGNTDRLALFDSMTCLTGFFHDVSIESLGEALLKAPGGAIAVWASTGMTDPGGQVLMNEEAMRQLFSGGGLTIGEVTARAKAATGNPDVRRTWILLGDPATKLK